MTAEATLDYAGLFRAGLPEPAPRFAGIPKYMFAGGHNDPEEIPVEGLVEAAATVLRRAGKNLAKYNLGLGPLGYPGLREALAANLRRRRGIEAGADEILVTTGSNQGLELAARLFVNPGDTALVEEFTYEGALSRFRAVGAKLVGMKLDSDGIVTDALAEQLADLKAAGRLPKFIYTIPTIQNPTGTIMPLARRHALIALSRRYGVPVIEDECYADLRWKGVDAPPAMRALDPGCVIFVGSFSKSLAPAVRIGYVVAGWPLLSRMLSLKSESTGAIDQMIVAEFAKDHFDDHTRRLSATLEGKLGVMVEAVEREFGSSVELFRPKGGIFLWMRLPEGIDTRKLLAPAAREQVVFNAGPQWATDPEAARAHFRLCFALLMREEIREGVAALARVCYEQTGLPAMSGNVRRPPLSQSA